jgi:hypothetical protein
MDDFGSHHNEIIYVWGVHMTHVRRTMKRLYDVNSMVFEPLNNALQFRHNPEHGPAFVDPKRRNRTYPHGVCRRF